MLFPGLGQVTVRRFLRGLIIFAVFFGFFFIGVILAATISGLLGYHLLSLFLFWLWNIWDAYRCTKEYNDNLYKEYEEPGTGQEQNTLHVVPLNADSGTSITVLSVADTDGGPLPVLQSRFCMHCGREVKRSAGKFCQHCGEPLS